MTICSLFLDAAPPLELSLRLPLSAMHFLEFAIWGAWFVVLGQYLETLKFTRKSIGSIYATMALGAVVSPLFVGSIADQYFASEWILGVLHLIGGVLLFGMAFIRNSVPFFWTAFVYALVYTPTLSLVNSVVFTHVPDASRDFPLIRVLGTIGWIAANLALKLFLRPGQPVNNRPLLLASALSIVMGVFSIGMLPHTPPKRPGGALPLAEAVPQLFQDLKLGETWKPFKQAFELLEERSFAVFFGVSFLITIALAFYYSFTSLYLERKIGVRSDNVGPLMTVGQWVELGVMFSLSWFLDTLGMRGVLLVGMAAWGLRYAIFAAGGPFPAIVFALALHGICFDFFFAAGFIHVEQTAPAAIRASGQGLFAMLTYGLGMYIGNEASGWLNQWLTRNQVNPATGAVEQVTDWRTFWLIPCVGVLISLGLFVWLF